MLLERKAADGEDVAKEVVIRLLRLLVWTPFRMFFF